MGESESTFRWWRSFFLQPQLQPRRVANRELDAEAGGGGEGGGNKTSEKLTETRAAWYELFASIPDFSPVPADGGGG